MRVAARTAAVLAMLAVTLSGPAALAAPVEVGVDEVVAELGLAAEPADYVVLVDTSGSMRADNRYARVKQELAKLVGGLEPADRVSLYTFDSSTSRRYRGEVGDDPASVLAGLPARAAGDHTDIGEAIAAGLEQLEAEDTRRLAALILITDGVLDAPGSPYANPRSSAWQELRTRASQLQRRHQVAGYAVSLLADTDAGLLKKVLPDAVEVRAEQVGDRFAELGNDMVKRRAAEALAAEAGLPVAVSWAVDLSAALAAAGPVEGTLQFTSPYVHLPVELTDFAVVASPGLTATVSGLPETLPLAPGQTVAVPVTATVTGTGGAGASVGLSATVTSSWAKVLTEDLGLAFAPAVEGTAPVAAAPVRLELPPTVLPLAGTVGGLALLGLLLWWLARALLIPTMSGLLTIRRNGRDLADIVLEGHRVKLAAPQTAAELIGLSGTVAGARGTARGERAVRVRASYGDARAAGLITDGASLALADLELTYTSGRRRILEKIGYFEATAQKEPANP